MITSPCSIDRSDFGSGKSVGRSVSQAWWAARDSHCVFAASHQALGMRLADSIVNPPASSSLDFLLSKKIHHAMKRLLLHGCLLFVPLALGGCGASGLPSTVPVTGTVTLDGTPVDGATVNLLSDVGNRVASGKTDASGKFSLKTIVGSQSVDGAIVGGHGVAVLKAESSGEPMGDPREMMEKMTTNPAITSEFKQTYVIPAKYNNPTMSGIRVEVTESGPNDITLDLKSR